MKRSLLRLASFACSTGLTFGSVAAAQHMTGQPTTAPADTAAPVERATADAVARLYAQVTAERIEGTLVSQIIDRVGGRQMLMDGLSRAEQIGGPRPLADDLVQVSLELSGDRAADLIRRAVAAAPEKSPIAANRVSRALDAWSGRTFASTGVSVELALRPAQTQAAPLTLPDAPPAWLHDAQTAEATAPSAGSPLRTARAAERAARAALRKQIEALQLDERTTLGGAGRSASEAVDLAIAAAKIAGVDYRADGSVLVRVSIDGQQLWQTLQLTAQR